MTLDSLRERRRGIGFGEPFLEVVTIDKKTGAAVNEINLT
jgi:hypothetical protein